ncbi:AMP-binding protein [Burkholderia glumae]|uniref:AMP-binding protein n=1 Tax=Burkholderia glumae TaxID=337 RepID=A0AAQ0BSB7_BURGL|nr:AMP-binding protein [Burkholderia glumae]ACR31063.1 Acyl-coenzyme A synthetase [Burkholderia glumae BGR1]AJY63547.1 AMP-binding enzyme family protein [Burkholderia glumae LMG 2196 = ATCC 33617]KHJ64802.1 AMP-dependent synthetase [Burkholderia glumae]MCM2483612.1 AMP-binding protein [Burkholderia glumae]MCM2493973.1 AMP-binding protein [Burkholderia glumae]
MTAQAFLEARDFLLRHRTDYDTAYREFRWPQLDAFNWALDYFDVMARDNASPALWIVDAVTGEGEPVSFARISAQSSRIANHLRALGVGRGERILLMLPNRVELWETMLAAMKLGAVVLPATTQLSADDIRDRVMIGEARFAVVDAAEAEKFDQAGVDLTRLIVGGERAGWLRFEDGYAADAAFTPDAPTHAHDPLLLYFTSGTTSKPKLVEHTHFTYPVGSLSTLYWIGLQPGDIHWNISSPGWAKHAWSCLFAPWNAGACVFAFNYPRFDPQQALEALVRYGVTTLCAPPTVWRMLVQQPLASYPVKLREIIGAGEPLNPEIIERVRRAWGVTIRDGYGQTETTCLIGNSPGQPVVAGSMGRPMPGYRIALLDPDGAPVTEGEIALPLDGERPGGLMTGYANHPDATAWAMRDGHYRTSDIALRRDDGYYLYIGRADDVFKSSDYRLSPFELESVLIEHEAVAEAAVVPSPDPLRLAVPKTFITLRAGFEPGEALARDIFRFSREKLAPYKRIRRLQFTELPKTISGKIRRVELRRREIERDADPAARMPHEYWEEDFPSQS